MQAATCPPRASVRQASIDGIIFSWESWLRHEVPMNMAEDDRIIVSINFGLAGRVAVRD
jgi:hypothetical protein